MAILAECAICRRKQATKNKVCKCGEDLDKAKRSKRVRFSIDYLLPNGKARREFVGYSIQEAQIAEGKRKTQRYENPRILEKAPDERVTFRQLADWYLGLEKVKSKAYYPTMKINLESFNVEFGDVLISQIRPMDIENYQARRKGTGYSDSYIDQEVGAARTMVNKAFDNDLVGSNAVTVFRKVKNLLKRNANARDKTLTREQFHRLMACLPRHTREIFATAFYTGMRKGEILGLTWDKVNLKDRVIQLEATDTKDNEPRKIPICDELYRILKAIPPPIHDNHVFQYGGKPVSDIRASLKRACKEARITYGRFAKDGFVFHDLRHTFNTYMRKSGVPESVIMEITGHSTREMFDRYDTVDEEDTRNAIDDLQGYLQNLDQSGVLDKKEVSPT